MSAITALMKLCPTLVRTGVPPRSRTTSGTAFEQMQLWRIVAPGFFSRIPAATIAVVVEPDSGSPVSSTRNTRSASPSKARPTSAPTSTTRAWRSRRFSGWIGSAGWLGKVPSSSPYSTSRSIGRPSNTAGTTRPPMPLAVSATTFSGRSAPTSTNDRTCSAKARRRSRRLEPSGRPVVGGHAVRRHGLDLHQAGVLADRAGPRQAELDAVVLGGVVRGGEHRARSVELPGGEVHEVGGGQAEVDDVEPLGAHAVGERGGELDARWGACPARPAPCAAPPTWPTTNTAKASPRARATSASSWSGVVPRMS